MPPAIELSPQEQNTERYCTCYLHEFSWSDGDVPYYAIEGILRKYQNYKLYC